MRIAWAVSAVSGSVERDSQNGRVRVIHRVDVRALANHAAQDGTHPVDDRHGLPFLVVKCVTMDVAVAVQSSWKSNRHTQEGDCIVVHDETRIVHRARQAFSRYRSNSRDELGRRASELMRIRFRMDARMDGPVRVDHRRVSGLGAYRHAQDQSCAAPEAGRRAS